MDLEKVREKISKNMPKEAPSTLKWSKISQYCLISDCKRFTVGKRTSDGKTLYEAWMGKTFLALHLSSADEAKRLCESHAHNLGKAPLENTVPAALQIKSKAEQVVTK